MFTAARMQYVTLLAAAAYFATLPMAVQALDTGELVACAHGGTVPHPPGYPAYVALYGAWIHLLPFGQVFWRASLLTAVLACATLAFVGARTASTRGGDVARVLGAAAIVLPLAASPLFWTYAVLPDVFMLNAACAAAVVHGYLRPSAARGRLLGMAMALGLGLLNHHTVVFLAM